MNWYRKVVNDATGTSISDAIAHYDAELLNAKRDTHISGRIEHISAIMPSIVENRFNQLQEVEAILEYLNIELRKLRSQLFRKYLEHYQRTLSSRDCEKFVDGEDVVIEYEKMINDFALLRNKWLGIIKALEAKGFSINNIIKLRTAGLDDATL